jgi:hypothetical protein
MHELTRVLSQALKWISAVSCLHAASASSVSTSISQSRTDMNRSSSVYIYVLIYVRWESMQWVEYKFALMDWWETYSEIWPWHMNGINQKEPHSIYLIPLSMCKFKHVQATAWHRYLFTHDWGPLCLKGPTSIRINPCRLLLAWQMKTCAMRTCSAFTPQASIHLYIYIHIHPHVQVKTKSVLVPRQTLTEHVSSI